MNIQDLLEKNKSRIINELYEWAETFDFQYDEEGEKSLNEYSEVFHLVRRFETGNCKSDDYKNILFHIEQINYEETKIQLLNDF